LVGKVVGGRLFTKLLKHVADLDFKTNGYWDDLDKAETESHSPKIIPRLNGILLKTDGWSVKSSLCHADPWEGNTGTSYETGDIYIFDSAALYAPQRVRNWKLAL
jgi:hypothetical protein